jgi:DNA excision repair protein ERCC-2
MPARFDAVNKIFEVSVRQLAEQEEVYRIGFDGGQGWMRLGLGAELHARVLRERCLARPGYRSEVQLRAQVPVGDWTAIITGRLDGCVEQTPGGWLIEEFKSTYLPPEEVRRTASFQRHQQQLLIYCDLWRRLGNPTAAGALVYVNLATGAETPVLIPYDPEKGARDIEERLARLLAIWKAEEKIREAKAEAAAALPFPHHAPRPGQQKIIDSIRTALGSDSNLMVQAPTGSGKTAAALHPALADGLAKGRQLFFLTAKTLQQTLAVAALRAMNTREAFRTAQIRAKEKMCANDRVICHEDFCPYAEGYGRKMAASRILDRLRDSHSHYDPDVVFEEAKAERVCPFAVQLELARRADAVVCDYNYIFEPAAALRREEDEQPITLLVDEAHNLADRARKIYSPELLEEDARAALEFAISLGRKTARKGAVALSRVRPASELFYHGDLFDSAGSSGSSGSPPALKTKRRRGGAEKHSDATILPEPFRAIARLIGDCLALLAEKASELPERQTIAEIEPPKERLRELWNAWEPEFIRYLAWKREEKAEAAEDLIIDFHFAWQRWMATLQIFGPGFTCVIERRDSGARLAIICLDPSRALSPVFRDASSTILLSATLSPFDATRRTLGLPKETTPSIALPPPFPEENRRIMIVPQVRTHYGSRNENFAPIARLLAEMSDAQSGNGLVLFPSYKFLEEVASRLPPTRARLMIQRPNFSDAERGEILDALASPPPEGILLLAVLGGMYAEGVDYPGELLSGVYIVSPGLPQVSFERELLRRYFDETEQAGFEYAYLQPGMTRVVQAAGRLIRSETDRGVIVLLCQRFLQPPYADHLPRDWYERAPSELIAPRPQAVIREFFENSKPGASRAPTVPAFSNITEGP